MKGGVYRMLTVDYAVSLGNVQPGVYFIRIDTAEGTVERKIRL